jgi:hypothetical protein
VLTIELAIESKHRRQNSPDFEVGESCQNTFVALSLLQDLQKSRWHSIGQPDTIVRAKKHQALLVHFTCRHLQNHSLAMPTANPQGGLGVWRQMHMMAAHAL